MFKNCCLHCILFCFSITLIAQDHFSYALAIKTAKAQESPEEAIVMLDALIQRAEMDQVLDTLALLYHTKGVKLNGVKDFYQAIDITKRAIDIRLALKDTTGLSQSYFNTAMFYKKITNEPQNTLNYFEKIAQLGGTKKNESYCPSLIYLGQIERDFGDYARAIQHLELGLTYLQQIPKPTPDEQLRQAQLNYTLGGVYNLLETRENLQKSLEYLMPAASGLKDLGKDYDLANCYTEISNSYADLNDYGRAITYLAKAQKLYIENDYPERVALTLNNIGIVYKKQGKYAEAIQTLNRGLAIRTQLHGPNFHPSKAKLADNLADVYLAQGQYATALSFYQQAIEHVLPAFRPMDSDANPNRQQLENASDKESLLTYLGDKAKGWLASSTAINNRDQLQKALATLQLADYLIDLMRLEHTTEESKLIWRRKVHSIYELALNISYQLSDYEQAFYFLEKSKSILLLDGLVAADARQVIPDSIAQRERVLAKKIIDLKKTMEGQPDDQGLRTQLLNSQKASVELVKYLAETYPNYHELRYSTKVIGLEDSRQMQAGPGQMLIQYFFGDQHIYIMAISARETQFRQVQRDSLLDQNLLSVIRRFQEASTIINHPKEYANEAYVLYQQLLAPILKQDPNAPATNLCIVLDGILQYLPFEALLLEPTQNYNLSQLPYLIKKYTVRYAYSASILHKQSTMPIATGRARVLGFAPFANSDGELGRLAFSSAELGGVSHLVKGSYCFDEGASREAFLENARQYSILHLSTHAAANADQNKPFIYFYDQKLYLSDLYALELPAELVVLSACETGLGKIETGEGVMSLARGFTFAGARSLISSLWSVNDQSTADLFTSFYQKLGTGIDRSKALHEAKLDYLNNSLVPDDQKSPYYWAGFVPVGGDGPLLLDQPLAPWIKWTLGLVLLIGIAIGIGKFRSA